MIKEYDFYISDERTHYRHSVQDCFDIICGSLKTRVIVMNEHWIWLDGSLGKFKSS